MDGRMDGWLILALTVMLLIIVIALGASRDLSDTKRVGRYFGARHNILTRLFRPLAR